MNKTVLVITFLCSIVLGVSYLYAQGTQPTTQKEEIILTTYYPTPYGDYERMRVNRISVGDTNGDGERTAADLPDGDGQLRVAKSVIYNPQGQTPANWSAGTAGELAFSKDEGAFYYYNGSEWVAQGGGGASLVGYGTDVCPNGWQEYYKGVAMTFATNAIGYATAGGGGIVCKAGGLLGNTHTGLGGVWVSGGSSGYDSAAESVACIVCVK